MDTFAVMTPMTKYAMTLSALALSLSACGAGGGTGHPSGDDKAVSSLDKQVAKKYDKAPWWDNIKKVHLSGFTGAIDVNTNLDADAKGADTTALAICDAYVQTSPRNPFVEVYAVKTETTTEVDGSKKTKKKDVVLAFTKDRDLLAEPGTPEYGDGSRQDRCKLHG